LFSGCRAIATVAGGLLFEGIRTVITVVVARATFQLGLTVNCACHIDFGNCGRYMAYFIMFKKNKLTLRKRDVLLITKEKLFPFMTRPCALQTLL
jgi:hypothetical protein